MAATPPASIYFEVSQDCRVTVRSSIRFDTTMSYVVSSAHLPANLLVSLPVYLFVYYLSVSIFASAWLLASQPFNKLLGISPISFTCLWKHISCIILIFLTFLLLSLCHLLNLIIILIWSFSDPHPSLRYNLAKQSCDKNPHCQCQPQPECSNLHRK